MSKQNKYDVLKYNEPAFVGKRDYLIPAIELQPIEVKSRRKYGRIRRAYEYAESNGGGSSVGRNYL